MLLMSRMPPDPAPGQGHGPDAPAPCPAGRSRADTVAVHWAVGVRSVESGVRNCRSAVRMVAGGHGQQAVCHSGAAQAGPNTQRLGHGAAGPEQPCKGQAQARRIARSCALGLRVSGQQEAHILFGGVGFFRQSRAVCNCSCVSAVSQLACCPRRLSLCSSSNSAASGLSPSLLPPMQACAAMTGGFGKIRVSPGGSP